MLLMKMLRSVFGFGFEDVQRQGYPKTCSNKEIKQYLVQNV